METVTLPFEHINLFFVWQSQRVKRLASASFGAPAHEIVPLSHSFISHYLDQLNIRVFLCVNMKELWLDLADLTAKKSPKLSDKLQK